jgi:hypothetical protein
MLSVPARKRLRESAPRWGRVEPSSLEARRVDAQALPTLAQVADSFLPDGVMVASTGDVFFAGEQRPPVIVPLTGSMDGGATAITGAIACNWLLSPAGSASDSCGPPRRRARSRS